MHSRMAKYLGAIGEIVVISESITGKDSGLSVSEERLRWTIMGVYG